MSDPTFGPAYDEKRDSRAVKSQMLAVRDYMLIVQWRTLRELSLHLGFPEGSVSAQLRHLKKEKFGGYILTKRIRSGRQWEYHLEKPSGEGRLF